MPDPNDELVVAAVSGDGDALAELLAHFGPQVKKGLGGRIAAHHQAVLDTDDVMQVTYLEAFLRIRQFSANGVDRFVAWMTKIAENNLLDAIRELERAKRPPRNRQVLPANENSTYAALLVDLVGNSTTPSRHAARDEARLLLEAALAKLPADYEQVVRSLDLKELPVAEVAAVMGRSNGAIYMLRARAHDRLREHLGSAAKFFTDSP